MLPAKLKCMHNFVVQLCLVVRTHRIENLFYNFVCMLQQRASPDSAAGPGKSLCGEDRIFRGHCPVFQHEHSVWHTPVDSMFPTQTTDGPRRPVREASWEMIGVTGLSCQCHQQQSAQPRRIITAEYEDLLKKNAEMLE